MPWDPCYVSAPPGRLRSDDPMELVGVALPADEDAVREMAYTFAEEFAQLGYGEERLLKLFRTPFYGGAHQAWSALGEAEIRRIVKESLDAFGGVRFVVRSAGTPSPERRRLPVLSKEA